MSKADPKRLPPWLRVSFRGSSEREEVRKLLSSLRLNTVCQSAHCPNMCECWRQRTATFMIMGNSCTRNCRFCAVGHAPPSEPESDEPSRVAQAAERLQLKFVVITSVTRDDLPDGGAEHFRKTVKAIQERLPSAGIEVLTPDFGGNASCVQRVVDARPTVFNHNIETCQRLTPLIRSKATYETSLSVLQTASERAGDEVLVKSGLMLGLGETASDINEVLEDLRRHGVEILTIGQYLAPSSKHYPVQEYVEPEVFEQWGETAKQQYGFKAVASAPLVRSSYMAERAAAALITKK